MRASFRLDDVVPFFALGDFFGLVFLVGGHVIHFEVFHAHAGVGTYGIRDEGVAADDGVFAHDGVSAENGCPCVNGDVVLDGGVTLFAGKFLAASCGKGAEGYALVNLHVLADDSSFANHDAGAMIDKKVFADGGSRVNVDARSGVRVFGHQSRKHWNMQKVKFVGDAEDGGRHEAGVSEDDFVEAAGSGVAIVGGVQIRLQEFADLRNLREEFLANAVAFNLALVGGHGAAKLAVIQRDGHLLVKVVKGIFDQDREAVLRVVNFVCAVPEMPGINHPNQILQNRLNLGLVGSIINVDIIDMLVAVVIVEDGLYGFFDFGFLD